MRDHLLAAAVLCTCVLASACAARGGEDNTAEYHEIAYETARIPELRGEVVVAGELLGDVRHIRALSEYVVVSDQKSEHRLHVFDLADHRHLGSFGRSGEGPGELQSVWALSSDPSRPDVIWALDVQLRRITGYVVERYLAAPYVPEEIVTLTGAGTPLSFAWLSDSLLVAHGIQSEGRLAFYDRSGRFLRTAGAMPAPALASNFEELTLQNWYQSRMAANAAMDRIVLANQGADRLEFYDPAGVLVGETRGPGMFEPREVDPNDVDRRAYCDVVVRANHVLALFSGRPHEGGWDDPKACKYLHVLDLNGDIEAIYALDQEVWSVDLLNDGETLYAVRNLAEPGVLRYRLPTRLE